MRNGWMGNVPCASGLKTRIGSPPSTGSIFSTNLWAVQRAAVPKRRDEARDLQRRDLHFTLADRLIDHIDVGRRVHDAPGFFRDLFDAGGAAQTKGARHICNIIRAVILE